MEVAGGLAFLIGAVVGSFLNVCIYRLPQGESLVFPPSHCRSCHTPIVWYHNLPLFSYLWLRGRCCFCGSRFPFRYFLVELLGALLALALFRRFGPGLVALGYFAFACALLVVTFIDLDHQIIPDGISLPGVVLGFCFSFFVPHLTPLASLLGALLGGGILFLVALAYRALRGEEGMGMGDVKLLAMIGAFLGWRAVLLTLLFASFTGSLVGVVALAWQKRGLRHPIPFGPFLSLGALFSLFGGEQVVGWYLSPL